MIFYGKITYRQQDILTEDRDIHAGVGCPYCKKQGHTEPKRNQAKKVQDGICRADESKGRYDLSRE